MQDRKITVRACENRCQFAGVGAGAGERIFGRAKCLTDRGAGAAPFVRRQ
jgi:hypothetical protein